MSDVSINGVTYPEPQWVEFPGKDGKPVRFDIPAKPEPVLNGTSKNPPETRAVYEAVQEIHQHLTSPYNFKGALASASALPAASAANANDTYYLIAEKYRVTSNGSRWEQSSLDESQYADELADIKNTRNVRTFTTGDFNFYLNKALSSNGSIIDSATGTRASAAAFIYVRRGGILRAADGFQFQIATYSAPNRSAFVQYYNERSFLRVPSNVYIRICVLYQNNGAITSLSEIADAFTFTSDDTTFLIDKEDIWGHVRTRSSIYVDDNGGLDGSPRMSLTYPIPVVYGNEYVLQFTYDNSDGDSKTINRIMGLDADMQTTTLIQTFELGGENKAFPVDFSTIFVIPSPDTKYIIISYGSKYTSNEALYTYAASSHITALDIAKTQDKVEMLEKQKFALKKNSAELVRQIVEVARSYVGRKNSDGTYVMQYGNRTPLQDNYKDDNSIDCSTFIGFVLRGIPYDQSPYGAASAVPDYDDDNGESTDNVSGEDGDYDWKQWTANPEYLWSFDPSLYSLTLEYDITQEFPTTTDPMYLVVRRASQVAQLYCNLGREVPIDAALNNIEPGDLVFWSRKKKDTNTWLNPYRFRQINHIALVISKEFAVETDPWDTSKHPFRHTYIEVTNPGTGKDVVRTGVLEAEDNMYPMFSNNVHTLSCVVRPDLGSMTALPTKATASESVGTIAYDDNYLYVKTVSGWKRVPLEAMA